jgi:hypothetical protein
VQGIWPPFADGTDVNAVDRSKDMRLLASADDFGRVKLFRCVACELSPRVLSLLLSSPLLSSPLLSSPLHSSPHHLSLSLSLSLSLFVVIFFFFLSPLSSPVVSTPVVARL